MAWRTVVYFGLLMLVIYTGFILLIAGFLHRGGAWCDGDEQPVAPPRDLGPTPEDVERERPSGHGTDSRATVLGRWTRNARTSRKEKPVPRNMA